jgi:amino acid transporter
MSRVDDEVEKSELSKFGYAQELFRAMGGFSSFALSFSVISVVTGIITTYKDALSAGGPAGLGLGWPLVCLGTIAVAASLSELSSAFPTAGALYHWSSLLGGKGAGWMTAAINLTGQVAIVAAIDFGLADQLVGTLGLDASYTFRIYAGVLLSHAIVNLFWVRLVAILNDFSATVHIVGVAVLVVLLFAFGRKHGVGYLAETGFTQREDHRYGLGFLNALLLGMFTFTGYDASAHLAEETHDAARKSPLGIMSSVIVSAVVGYALLCGLTLGIGDLASTADDKHAALRIMREALGPNAGRWTMALALFAMWFCGLSSVTSASRTLYAFARDRGVPHVLSHVSPTFKTPTYAVCTFFVAPLLLVVLTQRLSDDVFPAVASMSAMALYASYALPIACGLLARLSGRWRQPGPFTLGRAGPLVAVVSLFWCVFVNVVCGLPPNGLAAKLLLGTLVLLVVIYMAFVRNTFKGPKVQLADLQKRAE